MTRTAPQPAWISALLALFMVVVLPACFYGGLERARLLGNIAPPTSNNNEEREEHEHQVVEFRTSIGARPLPSAPVVFVTSPRPRPVSRPPAFVASQIPQLLPSRFSERRLI